MSKNCVAFSQNLNFEVVGMTWKGKLGIYISKLSCCFLFLRKPISKLPNAQMVKTEEQNNCVNDESNMALLTSLDLLEQN